MSIFLPARTLPPAAGLLAAWLAISASLLPAAAQEPAAAGPPKYSSWSQVENAKETRDYVERIGDGGRFDASAKNFLDEIALPQLGLDENRATIETTRRRIRERLLATISASETLDQANAHVMRAMLELAGNAAEPPVVRVNAVLLIGELDAKEERPWPEAVGTLVKILTSQKAPPELRVAAMAGLARHVEAASRGDPATATLARGVVPAILGLFGESAGNDATAASSARRAGLDWMIARGLRMLPTLLPKAPPQVATAVAGVIADESRPFDLRVRAAAALGTTVDKASGVDVSAVAGSIAALARAALAADEAVVARREFEQEYILGDSPRPGAGGGRFRPMGPGRFPEAGELPAGPPLLAEAMLERDAWRLVTLADALAPADGERGLAAVAGDEAAESIRSQAGRLRAAGRQLAENPDVRALRDAIESIAAAAAGPADGGGEPAAAAEPGGDTGNDDAAPASPFDGGGFNPFSQ